MGAALTSQSITVNQYKASLQVPCISHIIPVSRAHIVAVQEPKHACLSAALKNEMRDELEGITARRRETQRDTVAARKTGTQSMRVSQRHSTTNSEMS